MKKLLVLTLLWGSIAAGCQTSDLNSTSQRSQLSSSPEAEPPAKTGDQVAAVSSTTAESQRSCQMSAYVIDKDSQGLNVRSGPGKNYETIDKLPTSAVAVFVDIKASQGEWVQVMKAESPENVEFQGTGWVYAPLLGISTRGYGTEGVSVYANASADSRVMGRIPPATEVKLLGCDQSWALVNYEGLKGWIAPEEQCPNPLTTCS
ncbi:MULTISPECIES: SH3 domain-containing protein [unclassified Coleofasciculus]|uniref:SH3 domain-containing protein n=1 Tax=unclassified Coleofasciculus TaxID=2692782 RepID=UPI001881A118|nr:MULTISPECIES: SH3 domain-containing protein [unclassified Coleofasciculus]MBE9126999.1 SH3 domain-containing protein [Coleofasciculus sp. LEGE 07081]MBE9149106.1 SH3 domain-containing protein [Coleofasciculus sp. LEGE 07092]